MNRINNLPLTDNINRYPVFSSCLFFNPPSIVFVLCFWAVHFITLKKKFISAVISKLHQITALGGRFSAFLWSRTVSVVYWQLMKRNKNKMRPVWVIKSLLPVHCSSERCILEVLNLKGDSSENDDHHMTVSEGHSALPFHGQWYFWLKIMMRWAYEIQKQCFLIQSSKVKTADKKCSQVMN